MADNEGAEPNERARIVITSLVPDGMAMIPVELADETVLAIAPGHMSPQLIREWNLHATAHAGRWPLPCITEETERPGGRPQHSDQGL
ncbi:hypothetical protein GCM10010289_38110 [Streptomyces violascens]|uniref:Uncharacterized protein n=1 Tax=Streptomyces violascens TaxID=67381 RepID=A0ABQ3QX50_9ACTN|nr:hypothetical protein GCM10010289_38110 [Streptomyces violascens]GHI41861.1 hypothetical protein Sviol_62690 [Streptomyces violascens]